MMGLSQTQSCCPFFSGTRNLGVFYLCTSFNVFGTPDGVGEWFRFALRVEVFLMGEHSFFFFFFVFVSLFFLFFLGGAVTLSMEFLLWRSEGLFKLNAFICLSKYRLGHG